MSNDLNLCQFIGRLGKDPETRFMPSGDAVTNFSLAVGWKGKEKEGTEWVRCSTYGKLAEIAGKYLEKGKQCYVSGRMTTRKWTDKDGVERYSTEINVDRLQFLGSRGESKPEDREQSDSTETSTESDAAFDDQDIPF